MVGAHTDSCCLKVRPISKKQSEGFLQVGVELYGGGLWHTYFDRDLSLAGRIMVRTKAGNIESRLVNIERPILRVPCLAVHLDQQTPFAFDKDAQLQPIAGMAAAELDRQAGLERAPDTTDKDAKTAPLKALTERHHSSIVELVAEQAGVDVADVVDIELMTYDTHKSCIGGLNNEFVFSARMDNLSMCYCATTALAGSTGDVGALAGEHTVRVMSLFDHEEVGSLSAQGADSNMLPAVLGRLSALPAGSFEGRGRSEDSYDKVSEDNSSALLEQSLASSFMLSADMTHSVNPNYTAKYEADGRPSMNCGVTVKFNANQRYMTNSPGYVLIQEVAGRARGGAVPLSHWFIKNGTPCGSTIGPMLAGKLGARTLDVGNPLLGMHSIRETSGVYDYDYAIRLFESFWAHYGDLEKRIVVD